MAGEALVGEDGTDVLVVIDAIGEGGGDTL
jgi:hypothetical protein